MQQFNEDDVLVGDQQRQIVISQLLQAEEQGYLNQEEWESRVETATRARTETDLQQATKNLPGVKTTSVVKTEAEIQTEPTESSTEPLRHQDNTQKEKKPLKKAKNVVMATGIGSLIVSMCAFLCVDIAHNNAFYDQQPQTLTNVYMGIKQYQQQHPNASLNEAAQYSARQNHVMAQVVDNSINIPENNKTRNLVKVSQNGQGYILNYHNTRVRDNAPDKIYTGQIKTSAVNEPVEVTNETIAE